MHFEKVDKKRLLCSKNKNSETKIKIPFQIKNSELKIIHFKKIIGKDYCVREKIQNVILYIFQFFKGILVFLFPVIGYSYIMREPIAILQS